MMPNAKTCAPLLLIASATLVACGGPDVDEGYDSSRVVTAPSGPSGASGPTGSSGDTVDWWAVYDVLLDSVWNVVCDQWEVIEQGGVYAFCNAYLDSQGVPRRGIRRSIARSVCIAKVNAAIDDAVCTVTDFLTTGGDEGPAGPSGPSGASGS